MVFHAVLQYTLRPQGDGRAGIRCCVYKRHRQNSNGCLNRSIAEIKELLRLLFHCATFATPGMRFRSTNDAYPGPRAVYLPIQIRAASKAHTLTPDRCAFGGARLTRGISATRYKSHYLRGPDLGFIGAPRISRYQTRNIWCKLCAWGTGTTDSASSFSD